MSSGGIKTATAFWSYAHSDDEGTGGQIRRLKEQLDHAFKRHRGEALASFFDRSGPHKIEWGEEWRSKIRSTIFGTTFLIPVLSPAYVKSPICRQEFDDFVSKAESSDLNELILPILWVPVEPETEDEQRIFDSAAARQWIDWTSERKLEESSSSYKALIDEMGERLAKAARSVAKKPEFVVDSDVDDATPSGGDPITPPVELEPPLQKIAGDELPVSKPEFSPEIGTEAVRRANSFASHITVGFTALNDLVTDVLKPNPLNKQATPGQKNFYYKRIAQEMAPYVQQFETSVAAAEEDALYLNDTMYELIDLIQIPEIRSVVDLENVGMIRDLPDQLAAKIGDYEGFRTQLSFLGRMSRDLREPMAAFERAFTSLDEIMTLMRDWTSAFADLQVTGQSGSDPTA